MIPLDRGEGVGVLTSKHPRKMSEKAPPKKKWRASFPTLPLRSLRRRSVRRSIRRSRSLRLGHLLLHRLLRRLGVIHHNFLRWWRRRRGQRLHLRAQSRQLIFFARRQFLHALAKRTPRALQPVHVVAQILKLIFRSECSRRFHHRTKDVIQRIEVTVELETHAHVFRSVVQLRNGFRQRRLDRAHV